MKNAELDFIIFSENAFISDEKKLSIINIFDGINTEDFPAVHPKMSIITRFRIAEGRHNEYLKILKNENEVAITKKVDFEVGKFGNHQVINNLNNFIFPEEGSYKIEIYIDDIKIGEKILPVNKSN